MPFLFRKQNQILFQRETIDTPDGDFLDIDFVKQGNAKCAVLVHGLEGSAQSAYILNLAKTMTEQYWDVAAMNLRGCSGMPNKLFRAYHSGAMDDLDVLVEHLVPLYSEIAIIGFSLGGNITLKYAGEKGASISPQIKAVLGVSVPCHLSSSSDTLEQFQNLLYSTRFVSSLKSKLKAKMERFPGLVSKSEFEKIKTIRDFDNAYTAPTNGFESAEHYYEQCSSVYVLDKIQVPSLLINAQDDPFLSKKCLPFEQAEANPYLHFYAPKYGGHVGFWPEQSSKLPKYEEWIGPFLTK